MLPHVILERECREAMLLWKNEFGQVRAGWYILAGFIIMYVGQFIFSLPGSVLLTIMHLGSAPSPAELSDIIFSSPLYILLIQGAGTVGGIAATLVAWRALQKFQPVALGLGGKARDFFVGLLIGAGSIVFIFICLLLFGQVEVVGGLTSPKITSFTFVFLLLFILVGFFEELFFRGYVMRSMAKNNNPTWLIYIVSAIIFSFVHLSNPNVAAIGLLNIFFVGILFAYMFDKTGSLWLPIGYHITWNYFQGSIFGFPVSGLPPTGLYEMDVTNGATWLTGGAFGLEGGLMATISIAIGFVITYFYTQKQSHEADTRNM